MDHAFKDIYSLAPTGKPWEISLFEGPQAIVNRARTRSLVFDKLSHDSSEYRSYFLRRFVDALNHQVTSAFVHERISYYEALANSFGISDTSYIVKTREYVDHRPAIVRQQVSEYFDAGP